MVDRRTRTEPFKLGDLPQLTDDQIADKESENGLLQFDRMFQLIEAAIEDGRVPLTTEVVLDFQGLAVAGLEATAGRFREEWVGIDGTSHQPPRWEEVRQLVDAMCAYVNDHWAEEQALHLSAFVMWRLNWIHPFTNGNGRTSRVASYLVLCAALGVNLPGDHTVPEIIDDDKADYYRALDDADAHWKSGQLNVSAMESVIERALTAQLERALGTG